MNKDKQNEIQVTTDMVRQFLRENEDPGYREFHSRDRKSTRLNSSHRL